MTLVHTIAATAIMIAEVVATTTTAGTTIGTDTRIMTEDTMIGDTMTGGNGGF